MAGSLVRVHPSGAGIDAGSTASSSISGSDVPVGNVLVALTASRSHTLPTLSKPGNETATWAKLASVEPSTDGIHLWAIKTTVVWPLSQPVVATFPRGSSVSGEEYGYFRILQLAEFSGVDPVLRGSATTTPAPQQTPFDLAAPQALPGDLVLALVAARKPTSSSTTTPGNVVGSPGWQTLSSTTATGQGWNKDVVYYDGLVSLFQHKLPTSESAHSFTVATSPNESTATAIVAVLRSAADPPNAPTLTTMANGEVVDRAVVNRAQHAFSDPNFGDSQSAFDLRYRLVGAATWTDIYQATPNQWYDFPPDSLAAGDYERQVRTYDALGLVGPYSTSGFFTAADKPAGVTITDPVNGQTISLSAHTVTWSAPNQTSYQLRKVADSAGSPDTATVYYDSGEVASTSARSLAVDFPVNDRTEHVQVRVKHDGLWSDWATAQVLVSYTPPSTPVVTLSVDAATGSLLITITNPTPATGAPATSYNDVYIDDGDGEERKATSVTPNSAWRHWTPISGRDYSTAIRVVAVGTNGTTAST